MYTPSAQLRASADKVRQQAREVRFGTPPDEKGSSTLNKLMGRLNRNGNGRVHPRAG